MARADWSARRSRALVFSLLHCTLIVGFPPALSTRSSSHAPVVDPDLLRDTLYPPLHDYGDEYSDVINPNTPPQDDNNWLSKHYTQVYNNKLESSDNTRDKNYFTDVNQNTLQDTFDDNKDDNGFKKKDLDNEISRKGIEDVDVVLSKESETLDNTIHNKKDKYLKASDKLTGKGDFLQYEEYDINDTADKKRQVESLPFDNDKAREYLDEHKDIGNGEELQNNIDAFFNKEIYGNSVEQNSQDSDKSIDKSDFHLDTNNIPNYVNEPFPEDKPFLDYEALTNTVPLLDDSEQFNGVELETSLEENNILVTPEFSDVSETEEETNVQNGERVKRSSTQETEKSTKTRVKTGDTILNIRGAVRDAIGDAGAAPGPRASSRLDTFVIRPAASRDHLSHAYADMPRPMPTIQDNKNEKELLVEAHARARIECDLTNVTSIRWYKDNEEQILPAVASAGAAAWLDKSGVVVARATRGDAGLWRCAGRRAGNTVSGIATRLIIYEPVRAVYLAVDGRRLDAGNTWVPVRDNTVLEVRCVAEGGVPAPELTWRLQASEPTLDHRPFLRVLSTNYTIEGVSVSGAVVTAARELHNASLECNAAQRAPAAAHSSAKLQIHVTYPPSFVISRWPGFGVSLWAGAAAALRCDVDSNPPAKAWWLRDDAEPTSAAPPTTGAGSATLQWPALGTAHSGWYRCRASWLDGEYSSIGYYLNVVPEQESSSSAPEEEADAQRVEVPLGGSVQLHCPKGSVGCWWRRVVGHNSSEHWAPAGSHYAHGVLGIKQAVYQEGGEYRCVGARPPESQRLRELKKVTLTVTGGVTATAVSAEPVAGGWRLECAACGRRARVLWAAPGRGELRPAAARPDLAHGCWRAALHVAHPDEVWCVAVSGGAGAVAVFPARTAPPSAAPARRHERSRAGAMIPGAITAVLTLVIIRL